MVCLASGCKTLYKKQERRYNLRPTATQKSLAVQQGKPSNPQTSEKEFIFLKNNLNLPLAKLG